MPARKNRNKDTKPMLFSPLNYKFIGLGVLLIASGFTVMKLENEVYGIISLYISPFVILAGYVTVIFGILKRDHKLEEPSENATT